MVIGPGREQERARLSVELACAERTDGGQAYTGIFIGDARLERGYG